MSLILVIGGYGGFGARLCRRLSAAGHRLLVGGRSPTRAARFCAGLPDAEPIAIDRNGDVGAILDRTRPDLVVDAAGPFQASHYCVAKACIEARIPYVDLADARDFVLGIGALDAAARVAGVPVIGGASTLPALTGAIARRLAEGMERVHSVEVSLSVANRAGSGDSVARAILSYVGRPLRLWRGRRWTEVHGWQELRREDFRLADGKCLRGRRVAIADVADVELMPESLPGRPSVVFRAGTELGLQMIGLWLASWPVRWGWIRSLEGAGRWLLPLYRLTGRIGGKRSAMSLRMKGRSGGERLERCWTIIAEDGEGLEVPTLAAELLAGDILAGRIAPGARDASSLLTLERFDPALSQLAARYEPSERPLPPPLYARVMGEVFDLLPGAVRRLHDICGDDGAEGEGRVVRGSAAAARLLGAAMRFPPSGSYPLHVAFAEQDGVERWTRDFGGHRFSSTLSQARELIEERFGPIRFRFRLSGDPDGLGMHLVGWNVFGLRLPLRLAPRITAREYEEAGRFRFAVAVAMPLIGDVIQYSGWLTPID